MTAIDARYKPKIRKVKSRVFYVPDYWDRGDVSAFKMFDKKANAQDVYGIGQVVKVMVMEVE